jgi:hypothetical protein
MLCIFECTLLGGCWRSMIRLSNLCPYALKFVRQKIGAFGNWYLMIVNVLEVFDSNIWWWYWKFLDMGIIGMTFIGKPFNFMFCNFMFFLMKSLKLIKKIYRGHIVTSFCIHSKDMLLKTGYNKI